MVSRVHPLRSSRVGAIASLLIGLAACPAPSAGASIGGTLKQDAIVFEGSAPVAHSWSAQLVIEDAPPGDYFVFQSFTRPSSLAELAGFQPEDCASQSVCSVPGLGGYAGRARLDASARVSLPVSMTPAALRTFYAVVRRAPSAAPPADAPSEVFVKATIHVSGGGGCGDPDPPDVRVEAL